MGFLAKLLAPHVVGTPESSSSPSPDSSAISPPSPQPQSPHHTSPPSRHHLPPAAAGPSPSIDTSRTAHLTPVQRQASQLSLLLLGGTFMAATVLVTRRAVLRRQRESIPRFFHASYLAPDGHPQIALDGGERSSLAAQALGLATLNVAAFGVLLTGGTAWAFDLCSVAELQARTQMRRDAQGVGLVTTEEEREVDNMVMGLMERLGMDVDGLKEQDRLAAEKAAATAEKA